jgi:hypothetical protein
MPFRPVFARRRRVRSTMVVAVAGLFAAAFTSTATRDASPAARPVPETCAATVDADYAAVARRVYQQAVVGPNARDSVRRLQRSRALADAVARDDPAATRDALRPLLRADITRIVVAHGRRVLTDIGHVPAIAPVNGVIKDAAGTPVGTYRLSVFDDAGLAAIVHGLTGAEVALRAGDRLLVSAGTPRPRLARGRYSVTRLRGTAFPSGPVAISLFTGPPGRGLCRASASATTASATAAVGKRLYEGERTSAQTRHVLAVVAHDPRLVRAVATDDPAALRAQIIRFFRDPSLHVVRIRAVTAGGALVNDVGGPDVLAPVSAPVRAHGAVVGTVTLSVQDETGYIKLIRRFTGAQAVLRTPSGPVPGSVVTPAPQPLPGAGTVDISGGTYVISSFAATAFPANPLRISLLIGR